MNMNSGGVFVGGPPPPHSQVQVPHPHPQGPPHPPQQQQQQQQPPQSTIPPLQTPPEGTQQFCLRWNSYPATVATQLAALRAQEDFVDVTLACDGRQLKAHKLVLSACSPYFMQMFKSTPCQHPVIFLRDVGFRQLVALLEFMYAGEVNVSQAELPSLLRTAEALQVRGLADTTSNNNNNNSTTQPPKPYEDHTMEQPVIDNNTIPQTEQLSMDQSGCIPCTSADMPLMHSQPPSQMGTAPVIPATNNNTSLPNASMPIGSMRRVSVSGNDVSNREKQCNSNHSDASGFQGTMNPMCHIPNPKHDSYVTDGNSNLTGQEDSGEAFPGDSSSMEFDLAEGDHEIIENQSDEESSEVSDDDDGETKEFTYQSDASYSHEGVSESDNTTNGENVAGNAGPSMGLATDDPNSIQMKEGRALPGGNGERRNRLSRTLWPPGIPYNGPQQCPYCTRVLSNVGNWRKHVLTMHFAREKVYKCTHCTSAFRTAEYLQKHYVRVHNYPQKMTRRKYGGGPGDPKYDPSSGDQKYVSQPGEQMSTPS